MMRKILNTIYFILKKYYLKKKNIILARNISFFNTKFTKYNKVGKNTYIDNSSIGVCSYIGNNCILSNAEIGSFSSISSSVEIIYGSHPLHFVSTHPIFYSTRKQCGINFVTENKHKDFNLIGELQKSVIIGNDVWIGYGAKIIEGVTINDGAVILAGAIVTKDVDAYSIVGGIPAKHIKYRFTSAQINQLLDFKWWDKDIVWIKEYSNSFTSMNHFLKIINNYSE